MKNIIFLFSVAISLLSANDYVVSNLGKKSIEIATDQTQVGVSGVVIHKINEKFETIVARVVVTKIEAGKTILKVSPYKDLEQDALPKLKIEPQIGDRVKLNWLHERRLVIAPTLNSYSQLTEADKNRVYIHPDLFAAFLSQEGHPSPLKEDFQNFCKQQDVGLVEIAVETQLFKIDCNSFTVLEASSITMPKSTVQTPFYSRIKEIDADWWGEGSDMITDYKKYYLKLLGKNHAG